MIYFFIWDSVLKNLKSKNDFCFYPLAVQSERLSFHSPEKFTQILRTRWEKATLK